MKPIAAIRVRRTLTGSGAQKSNWAASLTHRPFEGRANFVPNRRVSSDVAEMRLKASGFVALESYPGSNTAWRIQCTTCGNESRKTLYQAEHHACKWCVHNYITDDVAKELAERNRLRPLEPYVNATHAWRMLCMDCGRESRTRLYRLRQERGCIYCRSRRRVDPDIAAEAARAIGLEPIEVFVSSRRPWPLRCLACGTEWEKRWDTVRKGHGCAKCSQRFVAPDTADAEFLERGFTPQDDYVNARTYRKCTCNKCGYEVLITREQLLNGRPCPFCSGNNTHPEVARSVMTDAGLEPLNDFESVDRPWVCRCMKCSRTVAPTFRTVRGGGGCIYCAQRKVDDADAIAVMTTASLEPLEPYPGSNSPWHCRCMKCQRVVSPTMTRVKSGDAKGCAYCSNRRVDPDDAIAIMESAGFTPLEPYKGGKNGWLSRCKNCGKESSPHFSSVQAGSACKWCRPYGIDLTKPAILYVMTHMELGAHKVGIAQDSSPRISVHQRYGWEVVKTYQFTSGWQARAVEQAVLTWMRTVLDLPPHLSVETMPQGGWTETVSVDAISPKALTDLVRRTRMSVGKDGDAD